MTYTEFMDLALKNYNHGGDGYVECWDERTFNDYVAEFGPITEKSAKTMFQLAESIDNEYRAAARYFGGEF